MNKKILPAYLALIAIAFALPSCISSKKYKELDGSKLRLNESFKRSQLEVRDLRARTLTMTDQLATQEKNYESYMSEVRSIRSSYKQDSVRMQNLMSLVDLKVEEFTAYKIETQKKIFGYENEIVKLNTHIRKQDKVIQVLSYKIVKERKLFIVQKKEIINRYERKIKNLATIKSSNGV
jgi:hypothetical protein